MKSTGKERRLNRIFNKTSGNTIIAPLDDSLLTGPIMGLLNLEEKIEKIVIGKPNAILAFRGQFIHYSNQFINTGGILNLSASTTRSNYSRKVIVGDVNEAVELGLDAVAVHVNITSQFEYEMLRDLGLISLECNRIGMPLVAIMYPRKEPVEFSDQISYEYLNIKESDNEKYADLVSHCVRIAVELGADIIKTQYTGSRESFTKVVHAAQKVPIVCAGGPPIEILKVLKNAYDIIETGGRGLSYARNIFVRKNPTCLIQTLTEIVHNKATVEQAILRTGLSITSSDNLIEQY